MSKREQSRFQSLIMVGLMIGSLAACKVSGKDLVNWKGTVKGPGKIKAVLLSQRYDTSLRGQAGFALAEIDRPEIHGIGELKGAMRRISDSEANNVSKIADVIASEISQALDESKAEKETAPPQREVAYKDAGYLLSKYTSDEARNKLVTSMVDWYAKDFVARSLLGDYSAEQIVRELGGSAATRLVAAIDWKMPSEAMLTICRVSAETGSKETKKAASKRIIQIADEVLSDKYLTWAMDKARAQFKTAQRKVSEENVRLVSEKYREDYFMAGVVPAMKQFSSEENVRNWLFSLASNNKNPATRRRAALFALEGNLDESHLNEILKMALAANADPGVQDAAFDRVLDIGSTKAIPRLWALVISTNNDRQKKLRQVAGETILKLGGPSITDAFFTRLPQGSEDKYSPGELDGYAMRLSQMNSKAVTSDVRDRLTRGSWQQRVIALYYYARKGEAKDVRRLKKLARDRTKLPGADWEKRGLSNIGSVAKHALKSIEERTGTGSKKEKAK